MMRTNPFFNFGDAELSSIRIILRAYQAAKNRGEASKILFLNFWGEIVKISTALAGRNQTVDAVLRMFSRDIIGQGINAFGAQLAAADKVQSRDGTLSDTIRRNFGNFGRVRDPIEVGGFTTKSHIITAVLPLYDMARHVAVAEKAILDAVKAVVGGEQFNYLLEADQAVNQLPKSGFVFYGVYNGSYNDVAANGDLILTHVLGTEIVLIRGFMDLIAHSSEENPLRITQENIIVLSRSDYGVPLLESQVLLADRGSAMSGDKESISLTSEALATAIRQIRLRNVRSIDDNSQVIMPRGTGNIFARGARIVKEWFHIGRGAEGEARVEETEGQGKRKSWLRLKRPGSSGHESSIKGI